MSTNDLVHVEFERSRLTPLRGLGFVLVFLALGFLLSFVVMSILSGVGVLMSMAIANAFKILCENNMRMWGWGLALAFFAVWFPLNVVTQTLFIRSFSLLAGTRRFAAASLLLVSQIYIFGFISYLLFASPTLGLALVMGGYFAGFVAQSVECVRIKNMRAEPLSKLAHARLQKLDVRLDEKLRTLAQETSLRKFEILTLTTLQQLGINKLQLRASDEVPIDVLIKALLHSKRGSDADAISRKYLELIELDNINRDGH